jgi:hypothetical protein
LAVVCLHNFTSVGGAARRLKVVEAGCLPLVLRALPSLASYPDGQKYAVLILGWLCDVAAPDAFEGLVDDAVLKSLVQVYKAHKDSDARVGEACRTLMKKLLA